MRYLYVLALVLFTGFYTFSSGSSVYGDDDDDKKGKSDDDDNGDDGGNSSANNNNYLDVNLNSNLNFTINQPEELENTQTLTNAIRLNFMTKRKNCGIYAKVASYTAPYGADKTNVPLELKHRSDNSNNVSSLVTTPLHLTTYDQRLFIQPKSKQEYNFYYDLRLMPLGYDYPEGQYNFTLMFTMTQE